MGSFEHWFTVVGSLCLGIAVICCFVGYLFGEDE